MQIEQKGQTGESNAYSLFVYAVRSQVTRDYYLRRLRIFFNHINLLPHGAMQERCNLFAANGIKDPNWASLKRKGSIWFVFIKNIFQNILI